MSKVTTIVVRGVKVNTLLPPAALPADMVPPDGQPAGNPIIDVQLDGSTIVMRAVLNGKSLRRALKAIAEHGPENVHALLQGNLKPPEKPGGPLMLEAAGLAVTPRTPKPDAAAGGGEP
jgi:hypothetical protein